MLNVVVILILHTCSSLHNKLSQLINNAMTCLKLLSPYPQVSKEGDTFEVPIEIAKLSNLVVTTLGEDDDTDEDNSMVEIPLPNVKAKVLAKVIEYCTHYQEDPSKLLLFCSIDEYC